MFDQERAHRLSIEAQLKKLRDAIDEAWITWGVEHAHATEADLDDVRLETIQEAKRLLDDADNKIQNLRDALEREKMGKGCF